MNGVFVPYQSFFCPPVLFRARRAVVGLKFSEWCFRPLSVDFWVTIDWFKLREYVILSAYKRHRLRVRDEAFFPYFTTSQARAIFITIKLAKRIEVLTRNN